MTASRWTFSGRARSARSAASNDTGARPSCPADVLAGRVAEVMRSEDTVDDPQHREGALLLVETREARLLVSDRGPGVADHRSEQLLHLCRRVQVTTFPGEQLLGDRRWGWG